MFSFVVGIIIRLANSPSLIGAWFILLQLYYRVKQSLKFCTRISRSHFNLNDL